MALTGVSLEIKPGETSPRGPSEGRGAALCMAPAGAGGMEGCRLQRCRGSLESWSCASSGKKVERSFSSSVLKKKRGENLASSCRCPCQQHLCVGVHRGVQSFWPIAIAVFCFLNISCPCYGDLLGAHCTVKGWPRVCGLPRVAAWHLVMQRNFFVFQ